MNAALLLLPDGDHTNLEAALAFLDSYDAPGQDLEASLGDHLAFDLDCAELEFSSESDSAVAKQSTNVIATQTAAVTPQQSKGPRSQPREKRSRAAPVKSHGHKEVAAELRQQVTHLAARLGQLQKRHQATDSSSRQKYSVSRPAPSLRPTTTVAIESRVGAYQAAMLELQQLRDAEKLNERLKTTWKHEAKIIRRLQTLLRQLASLQEASSLLTKSASANTVAAPLALTDSDRTFNTAAMVSELAELYLQAARISDAIGMRGTSHVFNSVHMLDDHTLGQTIEFTTNTPVACPLQELDAYVMTFVAFKQSQTRRNVMDHEGHQTAMLCYEHAYSSEMESQFGKLQLSGVSVARKFDEPHRTALIYTSRLALADTDLVFKLNGWLIMSERASTVDGLKKQALLQTFYRIQRDGGESCSAAAGGSDGGDSAADSRDHAAYFHDHVLMTKCEEMRKKLLGFQSATLEKLGSV